MHETPSNLPNDAPADRGDAPETPKKTSDYQPNVPLIRITILFEGGLAIVALGLGWLFNFPIWSLLQFDREAVSWGLAGSLPPIAALLLMNRYPLGPLKKLADFVKTHITPLFLGSRIWQLALMSAAAGIGEELLCRGFIQHGLQTWLSGYLGEQAAMWIALTVASVTFGLAHAMTREYAIACIVMGFYLGGLWLVTDNLLVPIIVHGVYDFVALVYMTRRYDGPQPDGTGEA